MLLHALCIRIFVYIYRWFVRRHAMLYFRERERERERERALVCVMT